MTSGAGRTITYDPENRPMTVTAGGTTTNFYYDGNGERVRKVSGSNTTTYIGGLYECTNGTCDKFIFANGQRIAKKTVGSGAIVYYHSDHLGSSSVVTDASGAQIENLAYYPYGQSRIDSAPGVSHHKYTDQELDAETGLYFYNARYYDPVLGRFISADTIIPNSADPQTLNRYSYVLNNPIRYTDPSGHDIFGDIGDTVSKAWEDTKKYANDNPEITGFALQNFAPTQLYGTYMLTQTEQGRQILAVEAAIAMAAVGYAYTPDPTTYLAANEVTMVKTATTMEKVWSAVKYGGITYSAIRVFIGSGNDDDHGNGGGGGGIKSPLTMPSYYGPGMIGHVPIEQSIDMDLIMGMTSPLGAAGKIAGFTRHGLNRAIQRGIKPSQILNAVRNPLTVSPKVDSLGRASTEYVGREATAVLNSSGTVITVHGTHSNLVEKLLGGN